MSDASAEAFPSEIARRGEIRRIGAERFAAAAETLAAAYDDDPVVRWSLAAESADLDEAAHRRYWRGVLAGLPAGSEVHATYSVDAVALWRPVAGGIDGHRAPLELVALAVAPASRGRGLARRLTEIMFARADRFGIELVARVAPVRSGTFDAVAGAVAVRSTRVGDGGPVVVEYRRSPSR